MVAIVALLLWLLPSVAPAATYYVATNGSNSNDGSEDTPFLTVVKCASMLLSPGDTCYVKNGTYLEELIWINKSGTASAPIKLLAYPGHSPVISFNDPGLSVPVEQRKNLRILLQEVPGHNKPVSWITIEGFTLQNGVNGVRWYNCQSCTIRRNHIKNTYGSGILGSGGINTIIDKNIIESAGDVTTGAHGLYLGGSRYIITNNIIFGSDKYSIQLNGNANASDTTDFPSPEYGKTENVLVSHNLMAYNRAAPGMVIWGRNVNNARIENNIFYQNAREEGSANGIHWISCCSTGVQIRNNHFYAIGTSTTLWMTSQAQEGVNYTQSGNVINVSAPSFVNAPATPPASPDFRLTAISPLGFALATSIPSNGVVGPYQPSATPTVASITANKITATLPMNAAVPLQNLSTAGVSFSCTANVCPGSPAVSSVSRVAGTDSQPEITLSGIMSDACLSHADPVTVSYNSSTGSWTGNDNIGPYPGLHQKILSFTSVAVTNNCTGSGPPGASAAHITYAFEDGTGTTVSDTSGNAIHATTSGSWVSGKTGYGIKVTGGTTQQTTIPYGSGIDPTTQSMTWVVPVFVATGTTSASNFVFGTEVGADQRGYIAGTSGTWKVGRRNINTTAAGASNLAVTEGWNHLCVRWDSATDTVTLYKDGVAGTGGATGSYTSYTLATNFEGPILGTNFPATVTETIYDDVQVFTSLQDCQTLYAAWNAPPPPSTGTLTQAAVQFQGVILDTAAAPIVVGAAVQTIEVPAGGGVVLLLQIHCENVSNCAPTAFKLVYTKNGGATWQQVPNTETVDGTWMWGNSGEADLNNGLRATRLTGSCTLATGTTQLTADQIPSVDLIQDGCIVLAYIVRVGDTHAGDYYDYKLRTESNLDFTTYTQTARIRVVNPMTSGIGF